MKKIIIVSLMIAALAAWDSRAQAPAPAKPAAPVQPAQVGPVKIGFINVHTAVTQSERGKAAIARLQAEVDQTKAKLDVKKKEIESLQAAFKANQDKWDVATKQAKQTELESKIKVINREAEDYEEYYRKRENEQLKPIIESLNQVITDIGKRENYTVIYDVTGAILYINPATELTDKVIRNFNAKK